MPFSFIRSKVPRLPDAAKLILAEYVPINSCLWWHHELTTPEVDAVILRRLSTETPSLAYGKLMERVLYFLQLGNTALVEALLPVAEKQLANIRLSLESPVVVLGDSSYSMDVAIRSSCIISSILSVLARAELRFFSTQSHTPSVIPMSAAQCVEVATATRADQQTAPAVALEEYYLSRKVVSTFIVVTDERENLKHNGMYFHQLFYRYYTEVHPAKIVFVSFLEPNKPGQMVTALKALGINPIQYRFDARRPDLTKFDGLLGLLSMESEQFARDLEALTIVDQPGAAAADP